ncbi:MAG: hypothetical protein ACLSHU_09265 [Oscillospiraceae bacterium]
MDRILVSFAESSSQYKRPERVQVVGMPVRQEFLYTRKEDARQALGLDERPVIVSAWGSLGAREMNKVIADFFRLSRRRAAPINISTPPAPMAGGGCRICEGARVDLPAQRPEDGGVYLRYAHLDRLRTRIIVSGWRVYLNDIAASGTLLHHRAAVSPTSLTTTRRKTPVLADRERPRSFMRRTARGRPCSGRRRSCSMTLQGAGPCAGRC